MADSFTWEQKLAAMQSLDDNARPSMIEPGKWLCRHPGEIGGDGRLRSDAGRGATPELAVRAAWSLVIHLPSDRYLVVRRAGVRSNYRWSGFMWVQVPGSEAQRA